MSKVTHFSQHFEQVRRLGHRLSPLVYLFGLILYINRCEGLGLLDVMCEYYLCPFLYFHLFLQSNFLSFDYFA